MADHEDEEYVGDDEDSLWMYESMSILLFQSSGYFEQMSVWVGVYQIGGYSPELGVRGLNFLFDFRDGC